MIKWMGALLLIGGCSWAGLNRSRELRAQVCKLERLMAALERMETEVCRLQTPLPRIMELLLEWDSALFDVMGSVKAPEEEVFAVRWAAAACALPLGPEERRAWRRLGEELSGGSEPERSFAVCRERLRFLLAARRQEAAGGCRLSQVLGLCTGLLAAILLA